MWELREWMVVQWRAKGAASSNGRGRSRGARFTPAARPRPTFRDVERPDGVEVVGDRPLDHRHFVVSSENGITRFDSSTPLHVSSVAPANVTGNATHELPRENHPR